MQIVISGTVGIGKSTISQSLFTKIKHKNENTILYEEIKDDINPYLKVYYENRVEWSFLIQIDYLFKRFKEAFSEIEFKEQLNRITIFDRHFLDDYIFANLKPVKEDMSRFQWNTYDFINKSLSSILKNQQQPDYFILLKGSFQTVMERLELRGREEEKKVDIEYWKQMYETYYNNKKVHDYLKENSKFFYIVDTDNKDTNQIVNEIENIIFNQN